MNWVLLCTLAVLQVADILTTNRALALGGREVNGIVRFFMARLGRLWWAPKIGLAVLAGIVLVWVPGWIGSGGLGVLVLFYVWIVASNRRAIKRLEGL